MDLMKLEHVEGETCMLCVFIRSVVLEAYELAWDKSQLARNFLQHPNGIRFTKMRELEDNLLARASDPLDRIDAMRLVTSLLIRSVSTYSLLKEDNEDNEDNEDGPGVSGLVRGFLNCLVEMKDEPGWRELCAGVSFEEIAAATPLADPQQYEH